MRTQRFRNTGADGKHKVWRTFLGPNMLITFPIARASVLSRPYSIQRLCVCLSILGVYYRSTHPRRIPLLFNLFNNTTSFITLQLYVPIKEVVKESP
jgi:hypothetical protein